MAGVRFFARLRAAVLECPGCGALYEIRPQAKHQREADPLTIRYWDALTGRFQCPACGRAWQLGVAAHALPKAHEGYTSPKDWRPTIQQAAWLRDQARGYLSPMGKPGSIPEAPAYANVLVGEAWPGSEYQAPRPRSAREAQSPPVHGSTWRQKRKQEQAEQQRQQQQQPGGAPGGEDLGDYGFDDPEGEPPAGGDGGGGAE